MKEKVLITLLFVLTTSFCQAQTVQQADSLHQRGRELLNDGKLAEGRECTRQAMEIRKQLLGEVSEDYITSLNNYALTFSMEENYTKAIELQEEVMRLCKKLEQPHKNLGMYAMNMGRYYFLVDDYAHAAEYFDMALPLVEKHGEMYEKLLEWIGFCYTELNDTKNMRRIMALMEEHNQYELQQPCNEPRCMMERAQYFATKGETAKAKEHFLRAIDMPMDDEMKVKLYEEYAKFMFQTKDYMTAADYMLSAANIRKSIGGVTEAYANLVYKGAVYSYLGKQYQQAVNNYQIVEDFYHSHQSLAARSNEAKCWKGIANAYSALRRFDLAKVYYQRLVAYYEQYAHDDNDYPKAIERVATAEKFNKEYEASINHYKQAMELFEQRGMMEEYADAATSLQLCYTYAGKAIPEEDRLALAEKQEKVAKASRDFKLDKIIKEETEGLEITREYLGKLAYAHSLQTIAESYAMKDQMDRAIEYYKTYVSAIREAVRDEFRMQNATERMTTWNNELASIHKLQELLASPRIVNEKNRGEVSAMAYDAALLSKGILLNSSIEFEKVLRENDNPELLRMYEQTKVNEAEIEHLRQTASSDADLERIVELTKATQTLQLKLSANCAEYTDFTDYISYDWKEVQKHLTDKDVAIEFIALNPLLEGRDDYMIAVVLTKNMSYPTSVVLWNNETLDTCADLPAYHLIQDSIMHRLFYRKCDVAFIRNMQKEFQQIATSHKTELTLYLHRMATRIEADSTYNPIASIIGLMQYNQLLDNNQLFDTPEAGSLIWGTLSPYLKGKRRVFFSADGCFNRIGIEYLQYEGKPLSEQFEVYRLSSTKVLCRKRKQLTREIVVLFGDINYNEEATNASTVPTQAMSQSDNSAIAMRASDGVYPNLGNALREINGIQEILKEASVRDVQILRDTEASKTAFLALSDSKVNMIHIATHGKYQKAKRGSDAESMQNSLLAFAGANIDDSALVTAADIASMNLRQCDMVVLSACETGLGKLGGDGVFGLQRGFKNAGVNTLLMSLKKVHDESTADLMLSFYRHLMNGSSKREALVKAQQDIRERGFKDSKYWASFILLDAF